MRSVAIGWSLVLVTILSTSSARATTLTVPDDVPTIQAALDATVDSVLVRPGMFPETPTIVRPVVLAALENSSQDLPTIAGVHVVTQRAGSMLLSRLRFSRSVDISNPVPNNRIEFRDCVADSAITSAQQIHYPAARLRSLRCTIHDLPDAYADSVEVDSCLIFGRLTNRGSPSLVSIRDCTFEGSTDYGIQLNSPQTCRISGNTIKGYSAAVNVLLAVNGTADVIGNRIEQCRTGMSLSNGTVTSEGNTIQGVRYNGIWCEANNITIRSNAVNASSYGIFAIGHGSVTIDQNVVGRCSDTGIFLEVDEGDAEIIRNTSYLNAKSGFYLYSIAQGGSMLVRQNIAYANSVFGMLYWSDSPSVNFHCNDWFGNRGGNFNHFIDSDMPSGDRSVDPMFCDIASDDVHLMAVSPLLADSAGCSWIGAFHTSCSDTIPTAALVAEFTAERELGGILVRWKLNDLGKSAAVRLERAELEDGPFVQVPVVPRVEAALMTVLDRDVTSRAYWYRLAGRVGDRTVMWVQPIHVEAVGTSRCALISVSPSPASGPVRIEFSSSDEKTVRVSVYDALGRLVASPIHGVLQAGRHAVLWPGATGQHAIAPGIYLVRFEYPGGQETKRICIVR